MKKHHILVGFLTCALLLPCWAGAVTIMDTPTVVETPRGEEATPAVGHAYADTPGVAEAVGTSFEEDTAALLAAADPLHTAPGDHTGWTALSAAGTLTDGEYYLSTDLEGNLTIPAGATVTLCLGGHTIDAKGAGSAITVNVGATLNLCDCAENGAITGGVASAGAGVKVLGTFNLYGGRICDNVGSSNRGGTPIGTGGGVYVAQSAVFNMYGGSISNNTAVVSGGGVQLVAGGVFAMMSGRIENNSAGLGGGVYAGADPILSGNPVISGNTSGTSQNNVFLPAGRMCTLIDAVETGASVGITMATNGIFLGVDDEDDMGNCRDVFFSDNSDYGVGLDKDGHFFLNVSVTVSYVIPAEVTGTAPASVQCIAGETMIPDTNVNLTYRNGYTFVGWTDSLSYKNARATITPTVDTTLYPVFYSGFTDAETNDVIAMTYGVTADEIDLNDFVKSVDESADISFQFGPAELPRGLVQSNGKSRNSMISGTPWATPGDYSVTFAVTQQGGSAVLFGLGETPAYRSGELTVTFRIGKPTLSAADFDFTPPADLGWNGKVKEATITPKRGISAGDITMKYSADPLEMGTYSVSIDVAENEKYQAAVDLHDDSWTFDIRFATPAPETTLTYGEKLSRISLLEGWSWRNPDMVPVVVNSGYQAVYTIPAGSNYNWAAEEGYDAASGTVTRTVPVEVRRATPAYTVPTGLTATEGDTLADVSLPAGWSWDSAETMSVGRVGTNTFKAMYTPADTSNYITVRRVDVLITVESAPEVLPEVVLGAPRWENGRTAVLVTPTPANLLAGARVLAARYEDGAMVDLAWGTLSGNTLTFSGKQLVLDDGWKIFFLDGNSYAPLCAAAPLTS